MVLTLFHSVQANHQKISSSWNIHHTKLKITFLPLSDASNVWTSAGRFDSICLYTPEFLPCDWIINKSALTKGWIGVPKVASEGTYNHRLLYFDHNCLQNTFLLQELNQLHPVYGNWPKKTPHLSRLDMTPSFNGLWCCIYCPQSKDGEGISKWSTWR